MLGTLTKPFLPDPLSRCAGREAEHRSHRRFRPSSPLWAPSEDKRRARRGTWR